MKITKKQKNYIKKYFHILSISEISKKSKIPESEIEKYTKKANLIDKSIRAINKLTNSKSSLKKTYLKNKYFIFFIVVLTFLIYFNSLGNEFISDDRYLILGNPDVGTLKHLFSKPWYFISYVFTFISYNLFGLQPWAFRIWNILAHIGSSLAVFFIIYNLFNRKVAVLTSLLFAVHPIMVESVSWISGYTSSHYTFFFLVAFMLYIYSNKNDKFYYLSILFTLFSLSSSQKALTAPLIFFIYDFLYTNKKFNFLRLLPFAVITLFYGAFGYIGVTSRLDMLNTRYYQNKTYTNPIINLPITLTEYIKLIFYPKVLSIYHTELIQTKFGYYIKSFFTGAFFVSFIYFYFKNKKILFWLLFYIIALGPTLTPYSISWIVAERYVYLGSLSIYLLFVWAFYVLFKKYKVNTNYLYYIFVILVLVLSVRTILRNSDWSTRDKMWITTAKTSPSSPKAHNNLADVYARHGDLENAINEFKLAIKLKPDYGDAYYNLGLTYEQSGDTINAKKNYLESLKLNKNLWQGYYSLGFLSLKENDFSKAIGYFNEALKIYPTNLDVMFSLAYAYTQNDEYENARNVYKIILKYNPNNDKAQMNLGKLDLNKIKK